MGITAVGQALVPSAIWSSLMFDTTRVRTRLAALSAAVLFPAAGLAALGPTQSALAAVQVTAAEADVVAHPGLVPQTPSTGYPLISDEPRIEKSNGSTVPREVLATDQVGSYIVSGGNFLGVDQRDGSRLDQPYFTAWNIDTKKSVCTGLRFDNEVLKVLPAADGHSVYVAGRFTSVRDAAGRTFTRQRVALVDLDTCAVSAFTPAASYSKVDELALQGGQLYVGGDFDKIGGTAISTLARLDATTGKLDPTFSLAFSGGLTSRLRALDVDPTGTRLLVAGRFGTVSANGVSVAAPTAVVDISASTPRLTPHSSTGYTDAQGRPLPIKHLQDASFSPDGSVVGLAYGTATLSDFVYLTPMTEVANTRYRWRHFMRDSSFGIGVSNNAVYVAGHFCKPDAGPGASEVMAPVSGITSTCTGATSYPGGVWRSKLAALSLDDGTPLTWNPGSHSFRGGQVVTVTARGLLVGFDGYRTNNIKTGALAFFDLGA